MAIDFPNSPTNNQTFTVGLKTWIYNTAETKWEAASAPIGPTGPTGPQGIQGVTGPTGAVSSGASWTFSTTTTAADPGSGLFRFNNATVGSVTAIYINETDAASVSQITLLNALTDSTATTKGYITFTNITGSSVVFAITAQTDNGAWRTLTVSYVSGVLPANNNLRYVSFSRTGDLGPTGPSVTGPTGSPAPTGYEAVTTQSGTSYTLAKTDVNDLVIFTNSSNIAVTVPTVASALWVVGERVDVLQKGSGQITFTGASGVTIVSSGLAKTRTLYSAVTLVYVSSDEWFLQGDTAVA